MKYRFIIGLLVVFAAGFFIGQRSVPPSDRITGISNTDVPVDERINFEPFWEAWNIINEKYVGTESVQSQDKVWGAIEGLAQSLGDPYTVFFPPEESKAFEEMIAGSFGGVGMEIGKEEGVIVVVAPLKDTPAERAGMRPGDIIIKIGETVTTDLSVDEAVGLIRGEPGTSVELTIVREGDTEPRLVTLLRDNIVVPTLDTTYRPEDGVFIISLYNFDAHAEKEFRAAMEEFASYKTNKLIIDLRGNPGGFLDSAITIASYFIPEGEIVVREKGDTAEEVVHRSRGLARSSHPLSMAVLVNGGSASASEIVAGALSEHGIATLVGEQTFGKGSVQELIDITPDTALKLTVAQWLTPNGMSISDGGLTPDIVVERTEEDVLAERDPQLEAAVAAVLKR